MDLPTLTAQLRQSEYRPSPELLALANRTEQRLDAAIECRTIFSTRLLALRKGLRGVLSEGNAFRIERWLAEYGAAVNSELRSVELAQQRAA